MIKSSKIVRFISSLSVLTFITTQLLAGEISQYYYKDLLGAYTKFGKANGGKGQFQADAASEATGGAIGDGPLLLSLAQGNLPPQIFLGGLPLTDREIIIEGLYNGVRAAKEKINEKGPIPNPEYKERVDNAIRRLGELEGALKDAIESSEYADVARLDAALLHLYSVFAGEGYVKGKKNYLFEFRIGDRLGFSIELIKYLAANPNPLRLAQFIFHGCICDTLKGVEGEKIDRRPHREVIERIQTFYFDQKEVVGLRDDLHSFRKGILEGNGKRITLLAEIRMIRASIAGKKSELGRMVQAGVISPTIRGPLQKEIERLKEEETWRQVELNKLERASGLASAQQGPSAAGDRSGEGFVPARLELTKPPSQGGFAAPEMPRGEPSSREIDEVAGETPKEPVESAPAAQPQDPARGGSEERKDSPEGMRQGAASLRLGPSNFIFEELDMLVRAYDDYLLARRYNLDQQRLLLEQTRGLFDRLRRIFKIAAADNDARGRPNLASIGGLRALREELYSRPEAKRKAGEQIRAVASAVPNAGGEIGVSSDELANLILPWGFFSNPEELEEHRKDYKNIFELNAVAGSTADKIISNILEKAGGKETRSIALIPEDLSESEDELKKLRDAGIRFLMVSREAFLSMRTDRYMDEEGRIKRQKFQKNTYAIMFLARRLDENTPETSFTYNKLLLYIKSHFDLKGVAAEEYIDAIVTRDVAKLIKACLSYKRVMPYDSNDFDREYDGIAETLIRA